MMRLNKFLARYAGLSRRSADEAIKQRRVTVNGEHAEVGMEVNETDVVLFDGQAVQKNTPTITIMLHKPAGYVCSRNGQGSKTVYDLLPPELHQLKPVGRLDKASSGLLLLSNDGDLANQLTHPRFEKTKQYETTLNHPLTAADRKMIKSGMKLEDGISALALEPLGSDGLSWLVTMREGRNRQVRRTFAALGYEVVSLHRTKFGPYQLEQLAPGGYRTVS